MLRKNIFTLALSLIITSCALTQKNESTRAMSVSDIENQKQREKIEINIEEQNVKNQLGPIPHKTNESDEAKAKLEPAIALVLPSTKDIIPETLSLMRELSKNGITPRIYAGVGMGAVMATALAFNLSADEIEWEIFSQEKKGVQSEREKAEALISRFKEKDLSQSFHVLKIPSTKGVWFSRGNVMEMLTPHLGTNAMDTWRVAKTSNKYNADIVWQLTADKARKQVEQLKVKIESWKESQKQD
tara:strand:+ start:459 stop:1190 length:732 start_codon:yes stop_codon:yes gene_type:complete